MPLPSFLSLAFLTYISIVLVNSILNGLPLNLEDALAIRSVPIIIGLGKIVSPLSGCYLFNPLESFNANDL